MDSLSSLLNRIVLVGAGLGLLAWGASILLSRTSAIVSKEAFLNGPITVVRSPVGGRVRELEPLETGMLVNDRTALLQVIDPLPLSDRLPALRSELDVANARLEAIDRQIAQLSVLSLDSPAEIEIIEDLPEEVAVIPNPALAANRLAQEQVRTAIRFARQKIAQAQIDLDITQTQAQLAQTKYERLQMLADEGALPSLTAAEAYNDVQVSYKRQSAAEVALETARIELEEQQRLLASLQRQFSELSNLSEPIASPTPPRSPSVNPLPASQNSSNARELASLEVERSQLQAIVRGKRQELTAAERNLRSQRSHEITAPKMGVVWEVLVQDGEQVSANQPLLSVVNCTRLWVDAFVSIDDLQHFGIGSLAEVRLYHDDLSLRGTVKTIRSHLIGTSPLGSDAAIALPDFEARQVVQVRIQLQETLFAKAKEFDGESSWRAYGATFCDVGQLVEVRIRPRKALDKSTEKSADRPPKS